MLSYETAKQNPRRFLALTGVTLEEFALLLEAFQEAWTEYVRTEYIERKARQRRYGGGRKPRLNTPEEQLFFILYYYKTYPLQEALAFQFGMSQSQTCVWIHRLSGVLKQALGRLGELPERLPEQLRERLAAWAEEAVVLDGTERRRQRPKDPDTQQEYYSGKKKAHTVKNLVLASRKRRRVLYLGKTHAGKKHDKKAGDEEGLTFPAGIELEQDLGFQGYAPEGVKVRQPKKKPRGKELTAEEKAQNRVRARLRVVVEHVISGIKRCRIVKEVLRNWLVGFADLVMEIACGLHNFRTTCRTAKTTAQPTTS